MVEQTFNIKTHRLTELKSFIRTNLPTARFKCNPYEIGDNSTCVALSLEVNDANKLNELFNKWYDIDNPKKIKKRFFSFNFLNRIFNRWTKWEIYEADKRYTKTTSNPFLGYESKPISVCCDVMKKTNKYTGMVKYKKVEKK